MCYLDLDGFNKLNTYGHEVGDQLLIALAAQMQQTLRKSDTLARIGGDEFVVVLNSLLDRESSLVSVERLVQAAAHPIMVGGITTTGISKYWYYLLSTRSDHRCRPVITSGRSRDVSGKRVWKNRYCLFQPM